MKNLSLILIIFFLLNCKNSKENDCYEIYNIVLKDKVSTYGTLHEYLPYGKNYSHQELQNFARKISDSLSKSKNLTYFLDGNLTILDTLNPVDNFQAGKNNIITEFRPRYSENKIDFSRIENLEIAKRISKEIDIDENKKNTTYLGSYDFSEPIFITKKKVVIRYQHHCGGKCGLGNLIYLEKINDKWKIIKEERIWIS